jgi:hypothetical protein
MTAADIQCLRDLASQLHRAADHVQMTGSAKGYDWPALEDAMQRATRIMCDLYIDQFKPPHDPQKP